MDIKTHDQSALVVKSNALINAMLDMGLQEMRFLAFVASQIPRNITYEAGKPFDMEINIHAISKAFNIPDKNIYRDVKKIADKLMRKIIEFEDGNGNEIAVGIFSKRKYHTGEGRLWFRFDEDLVPHLVGLTEHFTRYRIKDVYQFQRASTWRIYELLRQYKEIGKRDFDIDDLKWKIGVVNNYPRPTDLKIRIIDPALEEINATSDIKARYIQKKRGRRIVGFSFTIAKNEDTMNYRERIRDKISSLDSCKEFSTDLTQRLKRDPFNVSPKQARELANLWASNEKEAHKKLDSLAERLGTETIKSPGGYVFTAMKAGVEN